MLSIIRKLIESILVRIRNFISWLRCFFRGREHVIFVSHSRDAMLQWPW